MVQHRVAAQKVRDHWRSFFLNGANRAESPPQSLGLHLIVIWGSLTSFSMGSHSFPEISVGGLSELGLPVEVVPASVPPLKHTWEAPQEASRQWDL